MQTIANDAERAEIERDAALLGISPAEFLLQRIEDYFAGRQLAKLPKALADQQAAQEAEAEDAADEV